jgi:hypothetical protein
MCDCAENRRSGHDGVAGDQADSTTTRSMNFQFSKNATNFDFISRSSSFLGSGGERT